jgi:hypothetical protein
MSEPLAALLTLAAFWLAVREASAERARRGIAFGALVLGVAALVRPQALLCAPFLALVAPRLSSARNRAMQVAVVALVACAVALLPVLPWTARNCRVMDGCALVSTNGGWNLAIGAFPRATGRFETLRSSDGCREVTGQVQQDRCWMRYGVDQILAHPGHWLALVPAKLGFTFDHESFAVEYLHEARPEAWPPSRRETARDLTTFAHRLLLAAAALGCIAFPVRRRRPSLHEQADDLPGRGAPAQGALLAVVLALVAAAFSADAPTFWPLAVFASTVPWLPLPGRPELTPALRLGVALLATTLVTHAVFFGEDRYHVVVTPVLAMLAAAALRRPARSAALARATRLAAPRRVEKAWR